MCKALLLLLWALISVPLTGAAAVTLVSGQGHLVASATTRDYRYPAPFTETFNATFDPAAQTSVSRGAYAPDLLSSPYYTSAGAHYFRTDLTDGFQVMLSAMASAKESTWAGWRDANASGSFELQFALSEHSTLILDLNSQQRGLVSNAWQGTAPLIAEVVLEEFINGTWKPVYRSPSTYDGWRNGFTGWTTDLSGRPMLADATLFAAPLDAGSYRLSTSVESSSLALNLRSVTVPEPGGLALISASLFVMSFRRRGRWAATKR